jgi:hypothetical protein
MGTARALIPGVKSGTSRLAALAAAALISLSGGCARSAPPAATASPGAASVTGVWDIQAAPFGMDVSIQTPGKVQLEDLGDGRVDIYLRWNEYPIHVIGHLEGHVMSVHVNIPRVGRGLVVAHFNGDNVEGNAVGSYPVGAKYAKGQGVFKGTRRVGAPIGRTGVAVVDSIGDSLWRWIGAVYPIPDLVRASASAAAAFIGAVAFSMLGAFAMVGKGGRAVRSEGGVLDTIVLRGEKAAGHLVFFHYLALDESGRCEVRPKLLAFDPSKAASEDGVRGISFSTFEADGMTFISIRDLVLIVQLV